MFSGLYLKLALFAGIIAVLGSAWFYVDSLQSENSLLKSDIKLKDDSIREQNTAIEALKNDAEVRLKTSALAIEQAKNDAIMAKGKANIIYKTKPNDKNDLCGSALKLINGQ